MLNANLCNAQLQHQPQEIQPQRLVTNLKANDTCQVIDWLDQFKELFFFAPDKHRILEKFQCIESEQLLIHKWAWISIPRHHRTSGNTTPTPTVFSQKNVNPGYDFIFIDYNNISIEDGAGKERIEYVEWESHLYWDFLSGEASVMKDIVSTRGYVMNAEPDGNRVLLLEGTVEDPATEIELYCKKENWIGYFLPEEQNVFDALANIEED
ncbi:MAG: hypothetical protein Q8O72_09880, partial [Bacteroidales bacterium]|nr:hypothetical protein [Bacteroidales bacterium]